MDTKPADTPTDANQPPQTGGSIALIVGQQNILPGAVKPRHLQANSTNAAGDLYYVNSSGVFTRLGIGATGQVLIPSSTTLVWGNSFRYTRRVLALSAGSATPAINTDNYDVVHITAQTAAITSFTTNLTGTPVDGDTLRISITDDGTARGLTWGAKFESSTITLPTTTVLSTRLDVGFFWNTETSKWRCVAVA